MRLESLGNRQRDLLSLLLLLPLSALFDGRTGEEPEGSTSEKDEGCL